MLHDDEHKNLGVIPRFLLGPSLKWLLGFDGKCLLGAYINTFLKIRASYPRLKMCACEWEQGNYYSLPSNCW
jgi:hypothetical protein